MTREQAINYLTSSGMSPEQVEEVVKALGAEPCEDCISRREAVLGFEKDVVCNFIGDCGICQFYQDESCLMTKFLYSLPSVKPIAKNATTTEDCVSRDEVLDMLNQIDISVYNGYGFQKEEWVAFAKHIPSVRSKPLDDIAKPTEWPADSLTEEEVREAEKEGLALVRAYKDGYDAGYIAGVKAYRAFVELDEEEKNEDSTL